jgi:sarcosine oxidase
VSNPRSVHGVSDFVSQTASIAQQFAIAHQRFTSAEIQSRFSAFQLQDSTSGYLEPEGGYLRPERCIEAQLSLAQRQGAMLQMNEQVIEWQSEGSSVVVRTDKATYHAEKIIVTAGPWMNDLVPGFTDKIKVYRQVLYWFELESQAWYERYRDMPVYVWIFGPQNGDMVYGFPAVDGLRGGLKLAAEDYSVTTTPQTLNREVSQAEIASFYARYVQPNFKGLTSKSLQAQACMYTVTPQHKFLIDFHPQHPNVLVASPCSGHGFKHSAAIGEMLAQLATTGRSVIDAKPFGFEYL